MRKQIHTRSQLLARLLRIKVFVNDFNNEINSEFDLNTRLSMIENILSEFDETQLKIEHHVISLKDNEDLLIECDTIRQEFETDYYNLKASIASIISSFAEDRQHQLTEKKNVSQLRLPKVDLPKFNGSCENWMAFHDIYMSLIHDNQSLSDIQKFHYLLSALSGEAARAIHSLEISSANYGTAWNLIKQRYENKKINIKKHVLAMFELPHVQKESCYHLRELSDKMASHLTVLNQLGQPTEQWDMIIVTLLSNKMDAVSRREWELSPTAADLPTFKEIIEFLKKRCEMLEAIEPHQSQGKSSVSSSKPQSGSNRTSVNLASSSMSSRKCNMCDKKHLIYQCPAFLSLDIPERRKQVSKLKLCFNCLKDNHQREQCLSTWKCKECNASHNSLLHQDDQSNEPTSTNNTSEVQISRVLNNYSTTTNQKCFLSTAIIHVISASGMKIPCRVLLDSAAESNFITESMAQLLQLPRKRVNVCVRGISQLTDNVKHQVNANINSMDLNEI